MGRPLTPGAVKRFMTSLTLGRGRWAGQPFYLMPWQDDLTEEIFRIDPETGRRVYHEAAVWTPRKNAKTATAAAWALALLTEEPGGEVLGVAAKRDQAALMLDACKRFVRNSSIGGRPLTDFFKVRRNAIYYEEMDAVYRTVSSDASSEHGANPHAVVADELHAWKDPELLYAMQTATAARENPLIIYVSTPGERPQGVWWDLWQKSEKIVRGEHDDARFFAKIYTAPADCDVHDEDAYRAANPALGHVMDLDWLHRQADTLPEYVFRRLHLNQPTTAHERWIPLHKWRRGSDEPVFPDGCEVFIGIDAALSRDTFAVTLARLDEHGVAHVKGKAFRASDEGGYIDPADVEAWILGQGAKYRIRRAGYDPAYMGLLASSLEDRGVPMEPYPQTGTNMTRAAEVLQRLVKDDRLRHGGDPELTSQMGNVGVKRSDRGVRISKGESGGPVDLPVSMAMALDLANGQEKPEKHFAFSV